MFSRLRADDEGDSWQTFHDRYAPVVFRVAFAHGLAEPDARDTVQEVMLRFVKGIDQFEYDRDRGRFRNYLYTMTMNVIRSHFAKLARSAQPVEAVDRPVVDNPWDLWEHEWEANQLRQALDAVATELEPKTFQAFQLVALEEWPPDKVAAFLGVSRDAVYQAKSRVIKRLKAHVARMRNDEG